MHESSLFLSLPLELIHAILGLLDETDLLACTAVAKKLWKLVLESSHLQYTIELAKRRMSTALPTLDTPSYAHRLQRLTAKEEAWKRLTWKHKINLKIPPSGSIYEHIGDLYASGQEDDDGLTRSISFWELPSTEDANEGSGIRSWTHLMQDVTIIDFTMDPSQDLLVLVTLPGPSSNYLCEVHLRSIVTNEPHPKAPMTKLYCLPASGTPTTPERFSSVRVQVSGNLIALLLKEVDSDLQSHLEIWDWVRTPQISCKTKSRSGIEDFTFLSEDSFLLVRSIGSLETFTFPTPMTEACAPVCQYSYLLPLLSDGYFYWYITISSNPTPAFAPRSTGSTSRGKQLYSPKPTERIHVCSLCIFEPAATDEMQRVHCFIFFFNPQSLLHPPEDWIESAKKAKQRKYAPHYAYTAQPPTFGALPTVPSHTDVGVQTPDPASSSSSFQTDISPTTAVSLLPLPAHPRPILPRSNIPKESTPTPIILPWHIWGPDTTRWFQECVNTDWQHSVYGLRTIDSLPPSLVPIPVPGTEEAAQLMQEILGPGFFDFHEPLSDFEPAPHVHHHDDSHNGIHARYLRLRDYNPYSIRECARELEAEKLRDGTERNQDSDVLLLGGKGKAKESTTNWRGPRIVTGPTITNVRGAFTHDIVSRLPYVEVISQEKFELTDVTMDDCRLLLHERGQNGMLRRVDVLTM